MSAEQLITKHLDIWTSAHKTRSSAGRGSSSKLDQYGIKKLRELILELAVRGKLVPQDPNDEPASELLKKIAAEKTQLIKEGKIKKEKTLPEITDEEKPFELPRGWCWSRLGVVSEQIHYGYTASANEGVDEIRLLRITDIQDNKVEWSTVPGCEIDAEKVNQYQLLNDDILIARTGGTIGKSYLVQNINVCAVFASYLIRVKHISGMNSAYKKTYMGSQLYWSQLYSKSMGTGQPNVNGEALKHLVITVPPLAEQHRIVKKVDELMAFCDQLEQAQTSSIDAHAKLVETLLTTLTDSKDHQEMQANWQRIAEHFDTLFTTEESIDQLKQTILQLAVMGKLVPQDPNDEPASELLKKIAAEKAQLIKEGKIKKEKPLAEITDDEKPFVLPSGWSFARFYEVSHLITDGAHHTPKYIDSGVPFLSVKDMSDGKISFEDTRFISLEQHIELSKRCNPQKGDLLLTKIGTTGVPVLVDTDTEFSIFVSVALIKFSKNCLSGEYLCLLIKSPFVKSQSEIGTQGVGNKNLVLKTISEFLLAIPPLAEQIRIVEIVNTLIDVCDELRLNILRSQENKCLIAAEFSCAN